MSNDSDETAILQEAWADELARIDESQREIACTKCGEQMHVSMPSGSFQCMGCNLFGPPRISV